MVIPLEGRYHELKSMVLRFISLLLVAALLRLSANVNGNRDEAFRALKKKVSNLLLVSPVFPSSKKQFVAALASGGIDLAALRDSWGHRYRLSATIELAPAYRLQIYSNSPSVSTGLESDPHATKVVTFTIESAGPDGKRNTTDDLIAEFICPLRPDRKGFQAGDTHTSSTSSDGKGQITGILFNTRNEPVPNAQITLSSGEVVSADGQGVYQVKDLLPGFYTLTYKAYGFVIPTVDGIPVRPGCITRLDVLMPFATAW